MKVTRTTPLAVALSAVVASVMLLEMSGVARAAEPASVPVHVDTNDDNLEIFDRTNLTTLLPVRFGRYGTGLTRANVFAPICRHAPCDATVSSGTHVLAVARPSGPIVPDDAAITIEGPANVHAEFVDRSGVRTVGVVIVTASFAGSLGFFFAARNAPQTCRRDGTCSGGGIDGGLLGASMAVLVAGTIASLVLFAQRDSVSFSVTPLSLGARVEAGRTASASLLPNGLGLTMRF